jgi:hypothetical protein
MWGKKKPSAFWKERIQEQRLEDNTGEERYFDGLVEFGYEKIKDVETQEGVRIQKTVKKKVLTTYADLEFKHGDIIKID